MYFVWSEGDFDKYLDRQLARLRTDYVDTYLFHGVNAGFFHKIKQLNLIERMEAATRDGRIRHIGFSFHDTLPVFKEVVDYYEWDVVQLQYNYVDTAIQATTEGLRYAANKGMAVVIMEPLKGGRLAKPPDGALRLMRSAPVRRSPAEWALQFLWNLPEVSVALSGMGSMAMLDENCDSADRSGIGRLTGEEATMLESVATIVRDHDAVPCTACHYCMPCPFGVNIPENLAILNNRGPENRFPYRWFAKRSYLKLAAGPDTLNPERTNGRAALCTECRECVPKCPQSIDIPAEMKRVEESVRLRPRSRGAGGDRRTGATSRRP
jgi:hypothetical protein